VFIVTSQKLSYNPHLGWGVGVGTASTGENSLINTQQFPH